MKNVEEWRQSSKNFSFDAVGDELSVSRLGRFFPEEIFPPFAIVGGCTDSRAGLKKGKVGR
jgi:hypothetical protein